MKNLKFLISAFAFTVAIGASFAMRSSDELVVAGYIQTETDCVSSIDCSNVGNVPCTTTLGEQVYKTKLNTVCSDAMVRQN